MPLISPAKATLVSRPERIIARTTQDLVSRRSASVEQLGPRVVCEKLQSVLVTFVRLEDKRVIDRVVVRPEFVNLIEEWYRSRRRSAEPRQVENTKNISRGIVNLDRSGCRRKQIDVFVAA